MVTLHGGKLMSSARKEHQVLVLQQMIMCLHSYALVSTTTLGRCEVFLEDQDSANEWYGE